MAEPLYSPYEDPSNRNVADGSVDYYDFDWEEAAPASEETIFAGCPQEKNSGWCSQPGQQDGCAGVIHPDDGDTEEYEIVEE